MERRSFLHLLGTGMAALGLKQTPVQSRLSVYLVKPVRNYHENSVVVAENAEAASCLHPDCNYLFWDGEKWDLDVDRWRSERLGNQSIVESGWHRFETKQEKQSWWWNFCMTATKQEILDHGTWYYDSTACEGQYFRPSVDRVIGRIGPAKPSYTSNMTVWSPVYGDRFVTCENLARQLGQTGMLLEVLDVPQF